MISFIKKRGLLFIILGYFTLFVMMVVSEGMENGGDMEAFSALGMFIFTLVVTIPWVIWKIRSLMQLKHEKAKTELLHLKSQVNPHFFFNTLNNLYALVGRDTDKAKEMILKLSDMMRYSIYEGQKDWVTLEEEIEYLQNYIELHKMRYHKEIDISFNVDVQEEGYRIMPLLFIILLENAFKHGAEKLKEGAYVKLNMIANKKLLNFSIENNYDDSLDDEEGIGLKNLKRRLELAYPKKHFLTTSKVDGIFKAQLSIKLT
ncbi:MAG: histidine kinase [Balneolaceae bacterium]|nr:histidine kinase [Balneolaceae bacterium]MBO6545947.1 histidine kinase [Balneolaceae bacterium]MBO6647343.1 histidine kinase [Balneolaceae bacterium]